MNYLPLLRVGLGIIGLVIFGEAFTLLVGMHFLSDRGNPWISLKNDFFQGVDILNGVGLLNLALANGWMSQIHLVIFVITIALLSHGYRAWEYWVNVSTRFCINRPLFAFNNIKLVGPLVIAGAVTVLIITWY